MDPQIIGQGANRGVRLILGNQTATCDFRVARGFKRNVRVVLGLTLFFCAAVLLRAETSVEIDLQEQRAYLLENGRPVLASPISSGRYGHLTEGGSFKVIEKERNHYSSIYGKIVDGSGRTIVADADVDMKSFGRELSRDFVANAFVRPGNQHRFHVLFIGRVRIVGLQKILQQRLRIRRQFFDIAQFLCDRTRANIDVLHLPRCLVDLLLYRR